MLLKSKNITLTLFVSILFALTATATDDFVHRRSHENLKRLVRKRSPFPDGLSDLLPSQGVVNDVPDPNSSSASATASASAQVSASASSSSSASASASDSASASAASQSSSASSSASASSPSFSSSSSSSSSATTSPTSAAPPATPPPTTPTGQAADDTNASKSTVTHTNSVLASASSTPSTDTTTLSGAAQTKSTVTTVIIVVAASVGGLAILWTIFRKWKLSSSSKFAERMAPIDWQPTNDEGIVPAHRRTNSRASSFQSSNNHDNGSYHGHANLAPVGGYADLARGSSPQPQMQENYGGQPSLARGPSMTNGVPLHHQAGFGQAEAYDYNGDAVRF